MSKKLLLSLIVFFAAFQSHAFEFEQYCGVFPRPAQTYDNKEGTLWISADAQISGTKDLEVGFVDINTDGTQVQDQTCEFKGTEGKCKLNQDLITIPQPLPPFQVSSETAFLDSTNYEQYAPGGVLSPSKFKLLQLNNVQLTFQKGEYWIDTLDLNADSMITVKKGESVILHFKRINMNEKARFNNLGTPDNLLLLGHYRNEEKWDALNLANNTVMSALIFNRGDVYINGNLEGGSSGSEITGAVNARNIIMRGHSRIVGNSQCIGPNERKLDISPQTASANACDRIPVTFKIANDDGEIQEDISGQLTASATNFPDTACWATSADGTCSNGPVRTVNLNNGQRKLWLQNKAIGTVNVTASFTSEKTGELESEDTGSYTFTAGGYRISPSPLKMVAGKPEPVTIEATYGNCDPRPIPDYEGVKQVKVGTADYIQPRYADGTAPVTPVVDKATGEQVLSVTFSKGRAVDAFNITYPDAGKFSIPIEEVKASEPSTESLNNLTEQESATTASADTPKGDIVVESRPYTFAICGTLPTPKQISEGTAFKKAGEPFNVALKPVIWRQNDSPDPEPNNPGNPANTAPVTLNQSFCGRAPTPSFWRADALPVKVTLDTTARVTKPSGWQDALLSGVVPREHDDTNGANDNNAVRYRFNGISVGDVGSFLIQSQLDEQQPYFDMPVNPGLREIGRFYPSHFSVAGSLTPGMLPSDDKDGKGFTYLNQPFEGQYTVYAMTVDNQRVRNYHLSESTATFEEWALHPSFARSGGFQDLTSRWYRPSARSVSGWQPDANGFSQYVFDGGMTINKESAPDGPFEDVVFAVGVAAPDSDKTDFRYCDAAGTTDCNEPVSSPDGTQYGAKFTDGDFFFGRMKLNGFAETQDFVSEQRLEVAIEYFNGQRFETNDRDNGSFISTQIGEKEVLVSDTDKDIDRAQILLRSDAGDIITKKTVKNGRSAFIVEPPKQNGAYNREQFRYWQRLDKGLVGIVPQTWLQHNWQGTQFDDDPSAIGTFGFYRGSDRVIYKGEKNITLTGE